MKLKKGMFFDNRIKEEYYLRRKDKDYFEFLSRSENLNKLKGEMEINSFKKGDCIITQRIEKITEKIIVIN